MKFVPKPLVATRDINVSTSGWRERVRIIGVLFAGAVALYFVLGLVSDWLAARLPTEYEAHLESITELNFQTPKEYRPVARRALEIVEEMVESEGLRPLNYRVWIDPSSAMNAMAYPGGRIVLTAGLVDAVASENELAMVLGHELGHFEQRDAVRSIGRGLVLYLAVRAIAGESLAGILKPLVRIAESQYSQDQESGADQMGVDLLHRVYGHVGGATDFFERVQRESNTPRWLHYTSTHPAPADRIDAIRTYIAERALELGPIAPKIGDRAAESADYLLSLVAELDERPSDVSLRLRIAEAYLEAGNPEAAAPLLVTLARYTDDLEVLLGAAEKLTEERQHSGALELHEAVAEMHSPSRQQLLSRGRAYVAAGKHTLAETTFRESLALTGSDDLEVRSWLAHVLQRRGELDLAEEHLLEILALDPNNVWTLGSLSQLCQTRGRFEEALGYLERQIAVAAAPTRLCHRHVELSDRVHGAERAIRIARTCLESSPIDERTRWQLAMILYREGRHDLALIETRYVLAQSPDMIDARRLALRLEGANGNLEAAREHKARIELLEELSDRRPGLDLRME